MNALKTVLIPALLTAFVGVAMANDAPPDAKAAEKNAATATTTKKPAHKHKAKAAPAADAASGAAK